MSETHAVSQQRAGMLAIVYSVDPGNETDYLHWISREHTLERVNIAGFRCARLLRNVAATPSEYFTMYDLDDASVLASADYMARLNDPTPWSQKTFPLLRGMTRGGGTIAYAAGDDGVDGAFVAVLRLERSVLNAFGTGAGRDIVADLSAMDHITRVRVLDVDAEATDIQTNEKDIRGRDLSFDGLLIVEGLNSAAVEAAADQACEQLHRLGMTSAAKADVYSAVFSRQQS